MAVDSEIPADVAARESTEHGVRFLGWGVVTAEFVKSDAKRSVEPTPTPSNPYHADLTFELSEGDEAKRDAREQAQKLANNADYVAAP